VHCAFSKVHDLLVDAADKTLQWIFEAAATEQLSTEQLSTE
jgi:hypothetical protein